MSNPLWALVFRVRVNSYERKRCGLGNELEVRQLENAVALMNGKIAETIEKEADVTVARYENLIHDYGLLNAISQVPAVRDALHQISEMLKKHLK